MNMTSIVNFVQELDSREFYRYLAIAGGVFLLIIGVIFFFQRRQIKELDRRLANVNKQRSVVRKILQGHALVEKQRQEVNTILDREPNFRIKEFFQLAVKDLGLTRMMSKDPVVLDNDLGNGYTETQLESNFKKLDMKQVEELMDKIEQNNRLFTKELALTKSRFAPKVDATLIIATLQPKTIS